MPVSEAFATGDGSVSVSGNGLEEPSTGGASPSPTIYEAVTTNEPAPTEDMQAPADGLLPPVEEQATADDVAYWAAASNEEFVKEIVRLVNVERTSRGLKALSGSYTALNNAANKRAQEIGTHYSHTRPNGTSWFTVLAEYGITDAYAGENIYSSPATPAAAMKGWMDSSGHRANILNPEYNTIGVGYNYDANTQWKHHWVQLFIRRNIPATAVTLSATDLEIAIGKSAALTAKLVPDDSTDTISWTSSNYSIANLDWNGPACTVAGESLGTATVTARASSGVSASCTVAVKNPITLPNITGITAPVARVAPAAPTIETEQYTGTVAWQPEIGEGGTFAPGTVYTAVITLTAKQGYTFHGTESNYFTVAGAESVTNKADSNIVYATFPETETIPIDRRGLGLAAPVAGEAPATHIPENEQFSGTVSWSPRP
ncbi:MAG: CAP domain-containing protein, partial [Lachnospiraceae bacterium]|nr:CAP domain-containing protein [Lachnospiraceae bacterium]